MIITSVDRVLYIFFGLQSNLEADSGWSRLKIAQIALSKVNSRREIVVSTRYLFSCCNWLISYHCQWLSVLKRKTIQFIDSTLSVFRFLISTRYWIKYRLPFFSACQWMQWDSEGAEWLIYKIPITTKSGINQMLSSLLVICSRTEIPPLRVLQYFN